MQPLAAGIAAAACDANVGVMLAGGSQMVAVAALLQALRGPAVLEHVVVGTTRWVIDDPRADVAGLAADVSPDLPVLAVNLNFATSRHASLHAYEQCLVKEGVGAGGTCLAALLRGSTLRELQAAIDAAYDHLV
jgi:NaMN:DMB phosphoribosyltransferase